MTEHEWYASDDPTAMLKALPADASVRKFRLVMCELLRRDRKVSDPDAIRSIALGEKFADGLATSNEVREFSKATLGEESASEWSALTADTRESLYIYIRSHSTYTTRELPGLLRECFGNPFTPATFSPAWLTRDVVLLARGIYEEKAFDRMPILADALQDADCTDETLLAHCRDPKQVHVRGCWALDLALGKR